MNRNILITIKKELRGIVRDKKSLLMMLLTPLFVPVFIFLFSSIYDSMMQEAPTKTYDVGVNYELNEIEKNITEDLNIKPIYYEDKESLEKGYNNHEYAGYIIKEDNNYAIYANTKDSDGAELNTMLQKYLEQYNIYLGTNKLEEIGISFEDIFANVTFEVNDLEGNNTLVDSIISTGIVFAIMAITLTAVYGVTDTTAGEKERGTLETFLTFPIKSSELIVGKYLAITISAIITAIITLILLIITILVSSNVFDIYKEAYFNFSFGSISIALIILCSYSFFISGLCIAIASFSKSYKEAQSALTPVSLITMVPMFLDIMGVKLDAALSFIPVVSHTMLVNSVFTSTISDFSFLNLGIMLVSTVVCSLIILYIINKMYKSEKVLFSI